MNPTNILTALGLLIQLLNDAKSVSTLIGRAQSEGRDIAPEELAALKAQDDAARDALNNAIAAHALAAAAPETQTGEPPATV
jgi:hypothetical protein